MGSINIDNTGSGGAITLSSDGTSLLLGGSAVGGSPDLYAETYDGTSTKPTAGGTNTVAIGKDATSSNSFTIALGQGANASGSGAGAFGRLSQATGGGSHAFGLQANSSGTYATAIGRGSGVTATSVGTGSTAIGGSYASGSDSLAAAITNNTSTYGATGTSSIAMGYLAKASGNFATAIGRGSATGTSSVAIGGMQYGAASATGTASVCIGANYALSNPSATGNGSIALHDGSSTSSSAQNSIAIQGAATTIFGQFAFAGGESGSTAQTSIHVLKRATTNATASVLVANRIVANASPSTTNQIVLPNNSAYSFSGTIVARQQAADGTACAAWKVEGLIRREGSAGTTTLVGSTVTAISNTPSWGMALSADTTNGGLKVEATGAASTDIRWVATIHTSEVTYA